MATVQLTAATRQGRGKGPARQVRRGGQVPGVLYGAGEPALPLVVPQRELERALLHRSGGNVVVALQVTGGPGGEHMSLVREVQRDPVSGHILHIDFQHISMTQRITVKVPVVFHGVPNGVKNFGGILEHLAREVELRCLPGDIPERISLDVSPLNIGDSLHVRDLQVDKAEVLTEGDVVVATVVPPTVHEEAKPAEGEAAVEPELVGKEKAEGEAGEEKGEKGEKAEKPEKPERGEKAERAKDKDRK
ncbi:MAG TPA: 50S ribosomal protein L25 [Candidatus Saccharimonadales bacterium]|nr:50S ribosomal protein L25 [Candidatus Saccharimonadales bacterium]